MMTVVIRKIYIVLFTVTYKLFLFTLAVKIMNWYLDILVIRLVIRYKELIV